MAALSSSVWAFRVSASNSILLLGLATGTAPHGAWLRHTAGATLASVSVRTLDNILVSALTVQRDGTRLLKLPEGEDYFLLGRLDIADSHGPQGLHILGQHFGAALRHALREVFPHLGVGALEGQGEHFAVELAHQRSHSLLIDGENIVEQEHEAAHGIGNRLVLFLDLGQEGLGLLDAHVIEQRGERPDTIRLADLANTPELASNRLGDLLEDLWRNSVEGGHAQCHLRLSFGGKGLQQTAGDLRR